MKYKPALKSATLKCNARISTSNCRKVMFLQVSVCPLRGVWQTPSLAKTTLGRPPWADPPRKTPQGDIPQANPLGGYPPGGHPSGRHPLGRHPLGRYPLGRHTPADTPLGDTPPADTSPARHLSTQTSPQRRPLPRTVRILLEYILILYLPTSPVADPGFSRGGCTNSQKCYYFSIFLPKTAW